MSRNRELRPSSLRSNGEAGVASESFDPRVRLTQTVGRFALAGALLLAMLALGCSRGMDSGSTFTFPSGLGRTGWQYAMDVDVYYAGGSYYAKSEKNARVRISDPSLHYLLDEQFQLGSVAGVKPKVDWPQASTVTVSLFEQGDSDTLGQGDSYSQELLNSGPRLLMTLTYRYDEQSKKFVRVSKKP